MNVVKKLHDDRFLIDLYDLGMPNRTGSYILAEEKNAIIDTGASPSIEYILEGLASLHIKPEDIHYIIVTHIHLDHAGGAGVLLTYCPNAKLVVHPRGARHMNDPSRLILGAKEVYGEKFNELFHPIVPIPEDRMISIHDGDSIILSEKCTLTFFDTPGHANHHLSILDSAINSIYTGDTIGIQYPVQNRSFFLPSTSPNQFNPDHMLKSAQKIESLNPEFIYFGHFGGTTETAEVFKQLRHWLPVFLESTREVVDAFSNQPSSLVDRLAEVLLTKIKTELGPSLNQESEEMLEVDAYVSAMGLLHYFKQTN
jgi:glyoxylase-like metal-dependent hydrolase (beta-lactamase superfamily II)